MDKVIKDGSLRLLITESSCDVILSCSDHRLMAHKLILSIASPVLRELLEKHSSDSTLVVILPDVSSSTMSAILEYIYTGTVLIYARALNEFLSAAHSLQIAVDTQDFGDIFNIKKCDNKEFYVDNNKIKALDDLLLESQSCRTDSSDSSIQAEEISFSSLQSNLDDANHRKWNQNDSVSVQEEKKSERKLPALLPIIDSGRLRNISSKVSKVVVPSPWRQREKSFLGDPRIVPPCPEIQITKLCLEDNNNNSQPSFNRVVSKSSHGSLDAIIHNLHLNNPGIKNQKSLSGGKNSESDYDDVKKCCSVSGILSRASIRTDSRTKPEIPKQAVAFPTKDLTGVLPFNKKYLKSHQQEQYFSPRKKHGLSLLRTNKDYAASSTITIPTAETCLNICDTRNLSLLNDLSKTTRNTEMFEQTTVTSSLNKTVDNDSKQADADSTSDTTEDLIDETDIRIEKNKYDQNVHSGASDNENEDDNERTKHGIKKTFKCDECGKCFKQLRNYKYHRSIHEGTKEFSAKCSECDKTFNDRGYLSSHMKIHRDRKEYACPHCPKRFNQRVAYNMHLRIHTGVKPHVCPTCEKSFSRKMLLKQHQRVHTGERPYSCPECGKSFADRSNMSLHARLHTGVKPYTCNLCPKSFTKKHHLKTHMNFHTGLKPYSCEKCGLAFSQSSNMRTHYKKCILKEQSSTKSETDCK